MAMKLRVRVLAMNGSTNFFSTERVIDVRTFETRQENYYHITDTDGKVFRYPIHCTIIEEE